VEGLHDMYRSPNIIKFIKSRKIKWTVRVAHSGGEVHIGLWQGNLRVEGKRPLAKPRRRWENNIETDEDFGWRGGGHGIDSSVSVLGQMAG
jgi:hypothetical protein